MKSKFFKMLIGAAFAVNTVVAQGQNLFQKDQFNNKGDTLLYRILWPEDFKTSQKYPVIVFLHGAGERGKDNERQLIHGSDLFLQNRQKYQAIVIFPQCPTDDFWANVQMIKGENNQRVFKFRDGGEPTNAMAMASALLDSILEEPYVDTSRVYVGGLSMGGMGTFELVSRRPDTFAAAFAICGGGDPISATKYAQKVPFWIFHGARDTVVPPQYSEQMVEAIKKEGGDVKFSLYPKARHNSWDKAFAEPELLDWLFSNKK